MTDYPDDPARLTRLSEEVRGRLEEIALIATRIAGIERNPAAKPKFAQLPPPATASGHGPVTMVEIFDATSSHPQMCVTWWADGTTGLETPCGHEIYHSH
jgi:hypothetical protein